MYVGILHCNEHKYLPIVKSSSVHVVLTAVLEESVRKSSKNNNTIHLFIMRVGSHHTITTVLA